MTTEQVNKQFWTIERFVAFVFAPVATAGSGFVAAWLGKHAIHVTGDAIYGYASAVSLSVAGGIIKWLDGRSKHTLSQIGGVEGAISGLAQPLLSAVPSADREGLLQDIERIVTHQTGKLTNVITKATGQGPAVTSGSMGTAGTATVEHPAPAEPAWTSPNDPAPETPPAASTAPIEAPPPATAVVGDAGTPDAAPTAPAADAGAAVQGS